MLLLSDMPKIALNIIKRTLGNLIAELVSEGTKGTK